MRKGRREWKNKGRKEDRKKGRGKKGKIGGRLKRGDTTGKLFLKFKVFCIMYLVWQ